jgi:hypothetical protein
VTEHQGDLLPPDGDFFVPPPMEIGPVRTAHSSLRQGVAPRSPVVRYFIALGCGIAGYLLVMAFNRMTAILIVPASLTHTPMALWAVLIGVLPAWGGWKKSGFKHFCNYVGDGGCAQYECEGDRTNIVQSASFRFRDASSISTSVTRKTRNGFYNYTNFFFYWYANGKAVWRISGSHNSDRKTPPPGNPYNFARSAESAWYRYLGPQIEAELAQKGCVRFDMGQRRFTVLGPGFIDVVDNQGKVSRWLSGDIGAARLDSGYLTIAHKSAVPGKNGELFRFDYGIVHNARLFLYLFERSLGCKVQ